MLMRVVIGTIAMLCCLAQPCLADVLIVMRVQSEAIADLDVPASEQTSTTWLGENRLREDSKGRSTIVDLQAKKLYVIDHSNRSYYALDLPLDMLGKLPEGMRAQVEKKLNSVKIDVKVTPTKETKDIGGFTAKKYLIEISGENVMKISREQWMAEDIDFDVESFKTLMRTLLSAQPVGTEWLKKIYDIKGFPVLAESTVDVMGKQVKTLEQLISVDEKAPPEGTYEPPAGYTEEPFDFIKIMQQGGMGG